MYGEWTAFVSLCTAHARFSGVGPASGISILVSMIVRAARACMHGRPCYKYRMRCGARASACYEVCVRFLRSCVWLPPFALPVLVMRSSPRTSVKIPMLRGSRHGLDEMRRIMRRTFC